MLRFARLFAPSQRALISQEIQCCSLLCVPVSILQTYTIVGCCGGREDVFQKTHGTPGIPRKGSSRGLDGFTPAAAVSRVLRRSEACLRLARPSHTPRHLRLGTFSSQLHALPFLSRCVISEWISRSQLRGGRSTDSLTWRSFGPRMKKLQDEKRQDEKTIG